MTIVQCFENSNKKGVSRTQVYQISPGNQGAGSSLSQGKPGDASSVRGPARGTAAAPPWTRGRCAPQGVSQTRPLQAALGVPPLEQATAAAVAPSANQGHGDTGFRSLQAAAATGMESRAASQPGDAFCAQVTAEQFPWSRLQLWGLKRDRGLCGRPPWLKKFLVHSERRLNASSGNQMALKSARNHTPRSRGAGVLLCFRRTARLTPHSPCTPRQG